MRRVMPLALLALPLLAAAAQASPFGVGLPESASGAPALVAGLQQAFYRSLTAAVKALKSDGAAFWWLAGASFLYGVVHAAGPGHGKFVISSYLLANRETARRGILLSALSALVQAGVAVALVAVLAALLNRTSFALTETARLLELGAYATIALLGAWLVAKKGTRFARALVRGGTPRALGAAVAAHDHDHAHGACGCAHHHARPPERSRGAALGAVLAIGLRPCSGALIVLVFALSQGVFWAGIAATFLMAAGTAITVAALALAALGARDFALRFARSADRGALVLLGAETAAAFAVLALGALLLAGALA